MVGTKDWHRKRKEFYEKYGCYPPGSYPTREKKYYKKHGHYSWEDKYGYLLPKYDEFFLTHRLTRLPHNRSVEYYRDKFSRNTLKNKSSNDHFREIREIRETYKLIRPEYSPYNEIIDSPEKYQPVQEKKADVESKKTEDIPTTEVEGEVLLIFIILFIIIMATLLSFL